MLRSLVSPRHLGARAAGAILAVLALLSSGCLSSGPPLPPDGAENIPPVAVIDSSTTVLRVGDSLQLDASRSRDPDGSIVSFRWTFGDGQTGNGRSISHSYLAPGSFEITLTVRDDAGAQGEVRLRVSVSETPPADTVPPKVAIASPAADANISGTVAVIVDASDDVGVSLVELFADGRPIGSALSKPYSISWDTRTVADGQHTLHANARDAAANLARSADVRVLVDNSPGDNLPPTVVILRPIDGSTLNGTVFVEAEAQDNVGVTRVEILLDGALLGDHVTPPYSLQWDTLGARNGNHSLEARAHDAAGNNATSAVVQVRVDNPVAPAGKSLVGYWENWEGKWIPLNDVDDRYNVLNIAFPYIDPDGVVKMVDKNPTPEEIARAQARGKKILLSLGGQNGAAHLGTQQQEDNFVASLSAIIKQYGLDGIDIDLEHGLVVEGPPDAPTGPVARLISALKRLLVEFGEELMLTFAPETANLVGGIDAYGTVWGSYLPVFIALRDSVDWVHMQYYNTGPMKGLNDRVFQPGTQDFVVGLTEAVIEGFDIATTGKRYPGLKPEQVAIGLPATPQGGNNFVPLDVAKAALRCLKTGDCGSGYKPAKIYPALRGMMTWDVNWDQTSGYGFAGALFECAVMDRC